MDFAKVFDTVNHKILLSTIMEFVAKNFHGLKDYLTSRQKDTIFNGEKFSTALVSLGVPQGSVLGPLLLLICTCTSMTIQIFSGSKTILIADDMMMYLSGPTPDPLIHDATDELQTHYVWSLSNRLSINATKPHFLLFTIKEALNLPRLYINDKIITRTYKIEFLDVIYDDSLIFKHHIINLNLKI